MKLALLFIIICLLLVSAVPHKHYLPNDVSDRETQYFSTHKFLDSAVLSANENNYKTLSELRYRKRRDVSHLDLAYLPAKTTSSAAEVKTNEASKELLTLPSREYLPPVDEVKESEVSSETPQPNTTAATAEAEVDTESSHPKNSYLPPSATYLPPLAEAVSELPQVPSNEYLPPVQSGENLSQLPLEDISEIDENMDIKSSAETVDAPIETTQGTAVLDVDGYHYKTPDIKPDLSYLPALKESVVEAGNPKHDDTTVLQDDGYHYRNIKLRF